MKYTQKELKGNVNVSRTSPIKEFFILSGGILGVILVIYIVLGFAVDFVVSRLPTDVEQSLGRLYSGMYENAKKTPAEIRLQQILDELVKQLPTGDVPQPHGKLLYKVHLVPNSQVNAMALPGGNIVVFTALIKEVESENEMAFVLAHELGHFANRDHLRGLGRRLVLLVISTTLLGADNSATEFLRNSLLNVEMKFSQRQEREADQWALDLLNNRYGHVSGATDFFEKMSKRDKRGRILYYFATHPYPEDRVQVLEKQIQDNGYLLKEKVPLDEVFRDIKGVSGNAD